MAATVEEKEEASQRIPWTGMNRERWSANGNEAGVLIRMGLSFKFPEELALDFCFHAAWQDNITAPLS